MSSNPRTGSKNKVNNDPVDELKRRSRRRLVGSIALFLFAVIVVPALVEKEPSKKDAPIELVVPSRPNSDPKADFASNEEVLDSNAAKATVDKPAADKPAVDKPAAEKPKAEPAPVETTRPEPVAEAPQPEVKFDAKPLATTDPKKDLKPEPKAVAKAEPKKADAPKVEPKVEAKAEPKSEPKAEPTKPTEDPIAKFAQGEVLWVQVTALKDGVHAEQIRSELVSKGFPAKVESVKAGDSKVYRVRVGPLAGQDKANQTKAALAKQGYSGRVVQ